MKKTIVTCAVGILLLLTHLSCMTIENQSDGDWVNVDLDINRSQRANSISSRSIVDGNGYYSYPAVVIVAVKGALDTVTSFADLSDNFGTQRLASDNLVSFTLPVGDAVRLVRLHFENAPTFEKILSGDLDPLSIGISEPFSVDANTGRKKVQIEMPSVTFNLDETGYVKGVYKSSVTATKPFDAGYWTSVDSYRQDDDYGYNFYVNIAEHFLETDNRTLSIVKTIDYPFPWSGGDDNESGKTPLADGTTASKFSFTGYYHPKRMTAGTPRYLYYNYNDVPFSAAGWTWSYPKYTFEYDATTGFPTGGTMRVWDPVTDALHTDTNEALTCPNGNTGFRAEFSFSPRTQSDFMTYQYNGYAIKDNNGNTQCVFYQSWEGKATSTALNEVRTKAWFDANGTTLISDPNAELEGEYDVAKWSRTSVIDGNTYTETQQWYDASGSEVKRIVQPTVYSDTGLRLPGTASLQIYLVSNGVATLVSRRDYSFTKGFQTGEVNYMVENGVATASSTTIIKRDSQGRLLSKQVKDANGDLIYQEDYTINADGRRSAVRAYSISGSVKTENCLYDMNRDYTYAVNASGEAVLTIDSYCYDYTYFTVPVERSVITYSDLAFKTSETQYTKFASVGSMKNRLPKAAAVQPDYSTGSMMPGSPVVNSTLNKNRLPDIRSENRLSAGLTPGDEWLLDTRVKREFNASGAMTKVSAYYGVSGVETLYYTEVLSYDENLFIKSVKKYDADGDLHRCPSCSAGDSNDYKCVDQPTWPCYEVRSYTYK